MWNRLIHTTNDRVATTLRLVLGTVMFAHGAQKLLGWFGGPGLSATLGAFEQYMGVPAAVALLVVAAEFFGGLGLVVGLLTRAAAAGVVAVMAGAVYFAHWKVGFFMNWSGQQSGEGFEYHILAIALALAVVVRGGGWASLDAVLSRPRTSAAARFEGMDEKPAPLAKAS